MCCHPPVQYNSRRTESCARVPLNKINTVETLAYLLTSKQKLLPASILSSRKACLTIFSKIFDPSVDNSFYQPVLVTLLIKKTEFKKFLCQAYSRRKKFYRPTDGPAVLRIRIPRKKRKKIGSRTIKMVPEVKTELEEQKKNI